MTLGSFGVEVGVTKSTENKSESTLQQLLNQSTKNHPLGYGGCNASRNHPGTTCFTQLWNIIRVARLGRTQASTSSSGQSAINRINLNRWAAVVVARWWLVVSGTLQISEVPRVFGEDDTEDNELYCLVWHGLRFGRLIPNLRENDRPGQISKFLIKLFDKSFEEKFHSYKKSLKSANLKPHVSAASVHTCLFFNAPKHSSSVSTIKIKCANPRSA